MVEPDNVLSAVMADRLHSAGHRVEVVEDGDQALAAAARGRSELIVLELDLPALGGRTLIQALRAQPLGESVPILAISARLPRGERVEVLRAGADEILMQPVDLDELAIRVDRLTRSRQADAFALEGALESHPMFELMQFFEQAEKDGQLVVWSRLGTGRLRLGAGKVVSAEWQSLRGAEALLALVGLEEGRFRFVADDPEVSVEVRGDGEPLGVRRALMEAAWIRDELDHRRDDLPATGAPLVVRSKALPAPQPDLPPLPIGEILEHLREHPGARLFDLLLEDFAAPQRVRLALAWLCGQAMVGSGRSAGGGSELPSTMQIAVAEVLEATLVEVVDSAKRRGVATSPLSLLLAFSPSRTGKIAGLFRDASGWREQELANAANEIAERGGLSRKLATPAGTLALHLQALEPDAEARVEAIVSVCEGVVLWLDESARLASARRIVDRLEKASGHAHGVLIARAPAIEQEVEELVRGRKRWRLARHPPENLLGVLRLLVAEGTH